MTFRANLKIMLKDRAGWERFWAAFDFFFFGQLLVVLATRDLAAEACCRQAGILLLSGLLTAGGLHSSPRRIFIKSCAERWLWESWNLQLLETLSHDSLGTSAQDFHWLCFMKGGIFLVVKWIFKPSCSLGEQSSAGVLCTTQLGTLGCERWFLGSAAELFYTLTSNCCSPMSAAAWGWEGNQKLNSWNQTCQISSHVHFKSQLSEAGVQAGGRSLSAEGV